MFSVQIALRAPSIAPAPSVNVAMQLTVLSPSLHADAKATVYRFFLTAVYLFSHNGGIQKDSMLKHQSENEHTSARRSRLHPIHLAARVQAS